jgi:GDP-L-fucose synthase
MNFTGEIIWDDSKPNGQERKPSETSPLKSLIPFFEFTNLTDGLKTTIEWFEFNYDSIIRK